MTLRDTLNDLISKFFTLGEPTFDTVLKKGEFLTLEKGIKLFKEDQRCNYFYFFLSGIIKSSHSHNEVVYTDWIYFGPDIITSWHGFYLEWPSAETFQTTESSEIFRIHRNAFEQLKVEHPESPIFS